MTAFEPLNKQTYLNLETFRRSGEAMRTPVWFVQAGETIYVRTIANSGKVKRARNNPQVNLAPCKVDGTLTGEWIPAAAQEMRDPETDRKVGKLLAKKYGLLARYFSLMSRLRGSKYTVLEIIGRKKEN